MGALSNCSDFFFYGCFANGFSSSSIGSARKWFQKWKKRFTNRHEFANYWAAEGQKIIVVGTWVILNMFLFAEAFARYYIIVAAKAAANTDNTKVIVPFFVAMARGFGQLLNFNCALLILPTMRTLLNVFRSLKFGAIFPLDKNLVFHRYLAYW